MQKQGIKIEGHKGTWYVIGETTYKNRKVYLLENEVYGDESNALIVNEDLSILKDNVWNGFDELEDR